VTGSLPWFRYVFLSDALVELLTPHEVAAVFGHEVGHMAHRHLHYFGFFIVSSLLVLALVSPGLEQVLGTLGVPVLLEGASGASFILELGATLLFVGGYFLLVFGFVSRRFERQADVFGCRVASCGRADCPPHLDLDGQPVSGLEASRPLALCPVGIHTFISALSSVAILNGMKPTAWSWRHGSIARRIRFLEGLIDRPETERRFESGVRRMKWGMAAVLLVAFALAFAIA
jgi:STE24 endopeptidase